MALAESAVYEKKVMNLGMRVTPPGAPSARAEGPVSPFGAAQRRGDREWDAALVNPPWGPCLPTDRPIVRSVRTNRYSSTFGERPALRVRPRVVVLLRGSALVGRRWRPRGPVRDGGPTRAIYTTA